MDVKRSILSGSAGFLDISLDVPENLRAPTIEKFGIDAKAYHRASVRAVNKTARWYRHQVMSKIAKKYDVPLSAFNARFLISYARNKDRVARSALWAGAYDLDAIHIRGTPMRKGSGLQIGKFFFNRHFYVGAEGRLERYNWHKARAGYYRREGRARLPIRRLFIPISEDIEQLMFYEIYYEGWKELYKKLGQELNFEQKKAIGAI